jgi:hypothetical protein
MPVYCGFESIGIRDRCSPGCLRLERATSLVVPPHGHNWRRRRDSHSLDIRFERPTARLLGARRHKLARSRGLAPRSFGLTDRRLTLVELRIKWSGISVLARVSLRPKRSGFLSSSCPMADGGGLHPKPHKREFYQFSRLGAATQHFTIHSKWLSRRESHSRPRLAPKKISIARLPVTGSDVFGREEDIALLDRACQR